MLYLLRFLVGEVEVVIFDVILQLIFSTREKLDRFECLDQHTGGGDDCLKVLQFLSTRWDSSGEAFVDDEIS